VGIAQLVREHCIDIFIDFVGYAGPETQALLAEIDADIQRYVLMSSADVYRNFGLLHQIETGQADPGLLTEDAPLRRAHYPFRLPETRPKDDPQKWMDDYDKLHVEAVTREMASDWTICRLPMVFGPGAKQNRFLWAIAPMLANASEITAPQAWLNWTTTYGFVENVGTAIALAATHPAASRQTFNITDTEPVSHKVWLDRIADITGWSGTVTQNESADHPIAQATQTLDLSIPLPVSGERLRDVLGFVPPVSVDEALRAVLEQPT